MYDKRPEHDSDIGGDIRAGEKEERRNLTSVVVNGSVLIEVQIHS
jgi:hypothetical protein